MESIPLKKTTRMMVACGIISILIATFAIYALHPTSGPDANEHPRIQSEVPPSR